MMDRVVENPNQPGRIGPNGHHLGEPGEFVLAILTSSEGGIALEDT